MNSGFAGVPTYTRQVPPFQVLWTSLPKVFWRWPMILALGAAFLTGSVSTPGRTALSPLPPVANGLHASATGRNTPRHVVALGDSVTSGYGCGCISFPQSYGKDISRIQGWPVSVDNLGESGMDSADLLVRLDNGGATFEGAVAGADIVLVTIGANDFSTDHDAVTQGDCFQDRNVECVSDELEQMRENVSAILTRIGKLRAGLPTTVLVTGYWNVFESGDVARSLYPTAGISETQQLTRQVNDVLRTVTTRSGDTYVDLLAPFNGAASDGNMTNLLAADGDHPNAAGHSLIARQLVAAGLPGLARD